MEPEIEEADPTIAELVDRWHEIEAMGCSADEIDEALDEISDTITCFVGIALYLNECCIEDAPQMVVQGRDDTASVITFVTDDDAFWHVAEINRVPFVKRD